MESPQKSVCFYFQVHQPYRIQKRSFFEDEKADNERDYFADDGTEGGNRAVFEKVAEKCYLPMNKLLLELLQKYPEFHISFSLSGVFIEQCEEYGAIGQKVLTSFQDLVKTGRVEILAETYYHSLAFLYSKHEFIQHVLKHKEKVKQHFGVTPEIFRNTELIYSNELATFLRHLGYKGVIAEGWDPILKGHSPNYLRWAEPMMLSSEDYEVTQKFNNNFAPENQQMPILTKNYKLSDDMAFRFGNKDWEEHPLSSEKFTDWIDQAEGDTINLFMDFETFGEHQWEDTGIFEFVKHLPEKLRAKNIGFKTPSQTVKSFTPKSEMSVPHYISWADESRDLSAWLDNDLQKSALEEVHNIEKNLHAHLDSKDPVIQAIIDDFRKLQTSDHFYYMCTKYWSDGDVHAYFSPYDSPYDAYINYMNVLEDLKGRILCLEPGIGFEGGL